MLSLDLVNAKILALALALNPKSSALALQPAALVLVDRSTDGRTY